MKNTFKIAMIATLIATLIIVSTAFALPASAEEVHSVVIGTEYEEAEELWRIDCIAEDGNIWAFLADGAWGDWRRGNSADGRRRGSRCNVDRVS